MCIYIRLKLLFILLCFLQGDCIRASFFSVKLDSTQAKNDFKEVIKEAPSLLLAEMEKPENKAKLMKIFPKEVAVYFYGSEQEKEDAIKKFVQKGNDFINKVGKEANDQGLYENAHNVLMPGPWYLARYGFIFGAAVFAGFNGLYYAQQTIKDYLAIRKPKYISPLSSVGLLDQYKQVIKTWLYGFKKHKNDDEAQRVIDTLQAKLLINESGKKPYNHLFIHDSLAHDNTRLFGIVAQKLDMDFIAIPSINLLQKNNIVEIWNELVQIIHKNNRPILLFIDQAELLSMDGSEYSEREDNIRVLASCIKSSAAVFKSKCMIIGLSRNQEDLQGPFTEIFTKSFVL